jgi:hypothetical protein
MGSERLDASARNFPAVFLLAAAQAAVGVSEIAGNDGSGPVTIFYPSHATSAPSAAVKENL